MINSTQGIKKNNQTHEEFKMNNTSQNGTPVVAEADTKITILVPSFAEAAIMFHKQNLSAKGYRLISRIDAHKFYEIDGNELSDLFDGKTLYAMTFEYDAKLAKQSTTN